MQHRKCRVHTDELCGADGVFQAVSEGERDFTAIAISGDADDYLYPCGVCRQVMSEFCKADTFQIILVKEDGTYKIFTLEELLPGAFTETELKKGQRM